jgi:hypothetical protein
MVFENRKVDDNNLLSTQLSFSTFSLFTFYFSLLPLMTRQRDILGWFLTFQRECARVVVNALELLLIASVIDCQVQHFFTVGVLAVYHGVPMTACRPHRHSQLLSHGHL